MATVYAVVTAFDELYDVESEFGFDYSTDASGFGECECCVGEFGYECASSCESEFAALFCAFGVVGVEACEH